MTESYPTATTASSISADTHDPNSSSPSPLSLFKAFQQVQEQRGSIWKEYQDAFDTFLSSSSSSGTLEQEQIITQIFNTTSQGLIECSQTTRQIQQDFFSLPSIASLIDSIQNTENYLLKEIIERDQSFTYIKKKPPI